jgi:hypothetical protein
MKYFILSTLAAGLLTVSLTSSFAAPSDHNLKTSKGVMNFFAEQGNKGN